MDDEDKVSMISGRDAEFLSLSRFTVYLSAQDLDDQVTPTYEQQVTLYLLFNTSVIRGHLTMTFPLCKKQKIKSDNVSCGLSVFNCRLRPDGSAAVL